MTAFRHGKDSGLYLFFPDGTSLALTRPLIEARAAAILSNPAKIPLRIKEAEEFQLCTICPKRNNIDGGDTCHAIRPILAFWENVDQHFSHDEVTAEYWDADSGLIISAETTMQRALQFLSILSLMYYCEVGKQYWRYLYGVHPLMETDDVVARVYQNMFWANGGDVLKTRALITAFHDEITTTTHCQMERIRLFCSHDAFLNALILTQLAAEFLAMDAERTVRQRVEGFDKLLPA
jgi:hypothetical protein